MVGNQEGPVLHRRRRSLGAEKDRSFTGEGPRQDRRRVGPSPEKEIVGIGEGSVLHRRWKSSGSERDRSFIQEDAVGIKERTVLHRRRSRPDRTRIGPSLKKEEVHSFPSGPRRTATTISIRAARIPSPPWSDPTQRLIDADHAREHLRLGLRHGVVGLRVGALGIEQAVPSSPAPDQE